MDTKKGVYGKYRIQKTNGKPLDLEAIYFVLRIDKDKYARKALDSMIRELYKDGEENSEYCKDLIRLMMLTNNIAYLVDEHKEKAKEMVSRKEPDHD